MLVLNSWLMRPNERQPKRGSKVLQCGQFGGARVTTDTVTLAAHICGSHGQHRPVLGLRGRHVVTRHHRPLRPCDPGLWHVLGQEQALWKLVPRLCDYANMHHSSFSITQGNKGPEADYCTNADTAWRNKGLNCCNNNQDNCTINVCNY